MIKKLLTSLILSILTAATPSYVLAATLSLSPSSGTFNKGCSYTLDINLNTDGAETDGTDAILLYDNTKFTGITINTELTPKIYNDFPGSNDDNAGKVTVSGLASVSSAFKGSGTMAKVEFRVKDAAGTGATIVKFDYDGTGKTTDSNVVQRGTALDILSNVTNGNYTIGTGTCPGASPTPAPVTVLPGTGGPSQGAVFVATPPAQPKELPPVYKTLPPAGSEQLTFTIAIVGSVLTVLGILGLAFL